MTYTNRARLFAMALVAAPLVAQSTQFVNMNPMYFTMTAGGLNPLPQTFLVTSTGSQFPFTDSIATASGGNWLISSTACESFCYTPQPITLSIDGAALPVGTYTGQITFTTGAISMSVSVILNVVPTGTTIFGGMATQLSFVFGGGANPLPPAQSIQIANAGTGPLNWTLTTTVYQGGNWVSVSATSGTAPSTVTVSVSPASLAPGVYTGQLFLQTGVYAVTIPLSFTVTAAGTPVFSPMRGLSFTMPLGGPNPAPQTFILTSTAAQFHFDATVFTATGGFWLQNNSACVSSCPTPQVITLGVAGAGLAAGTYSAQAVFSAGAIAMSVPVTLTVVAPGTPSLAGTVGELNFVFGGYGSLNAQPLGQPIQIANAGSGSLNWTLTATTFQGGNWLSVSSQSGKAPATVFVNVSSGARMIPTIAARRFDRQCA